eukprot:TRINITY_DN11599_c0_g1_i1.p1 TRINITY_DN11599_c0_g1~~TRINITY_DN11599_c0_g1_i1.p1  ORF type:complete len:806 (-),score=104.88 TRINITY_DN11599_c0_g1_i1:250-2667(-)
MPRSRQVFAVLFFALFALGEAAIVSWDSTSDGIWNGPFWDLPLLQGYCCPTSSDDVRIVKGSSSSSYTVIAPENANCKSLVVGVDSTTSAPAAKLSIAKRMSVSSGPIHIYNRARIELALFGQLLCSTTSTMSINSGAEFRINLNASITGCNVAVKSGGLFNGASGYFTYDGGSSRSITIESGGRFSIGDLFYLSTAPNTLFTCAGALDLSGTGVVQVYGAIDLQSSCVTTLSGSAFMDFYGTINIRTRMTFTDKVIMHNVGDIRISDGAVVSLLSPLSSLGLSDNALIEGAGTKIFVNQSSIFGGYANIVIRDGPQIAVDRGAFIAAGVDEFKMVARNSSFYIYESIVFFNDANLTAIYMFVDGRDNSAAAVLRPIMQLDSSIVDGIRKAEIRLQRPNSTASATNITQTITRSTITLRSKARLSADSLLELRYSTLLNVFGGELAAFAGIRVCNNSKVIVSGSGGEFRVTLRGLDICDQSEVVIQDQSKLIMGDLTGNYAFDIARLIDLDFDNLNQTQISENYDIRTDATSKVKITTAGRLEAIGVIYGNVENTGGVVGYRNGSQVGLLYVEKFNQTGNGTLETTLIFSNTSNNVSSSTNLVTGSASVGGVISITIPTELDGAIRNGTANTTFSSGSGGILLINSTGALTLDSPTLAVKTSSGAPAECGYVLEQRGKSLFLVFDADAAGCYSKGGLSPSGAPASTSGGGNIIPGESGFPGYAIAIIIVVFIILVAGFILAVLKVPALRRRFFRMDAAEHEMARKLKRSQPPAAEGTAASASPAETRPQTWARSAPSSAQLKNVE